MARLFVGVDYLRVVRIAGAGALVLLAFFFGSLVPLLRAAPIAGTALSDRTPPVSVNRDLKGDRLPLVKSMDNSDRAGSTHTIWWDLRGLDGAPARREVPVGCDPAFSPVVSPSLATVYGRCLT